jgi:hypothetical protein
MEHEKNTPEPSRGPEQVPPGHVEQTLFATIPLTPLEKRVYWLRHCGLDYDEINVEIFLDFGPVAVMEAIYHRAQAKAEMFGLEGGA